MVNTRIYPTPSTTKYYISQSGGGKHYLVDDMYRVDFQRRVTHQPIYGYNSRKFDFVAKGKELTTGNIVINFRYPAYLYNLLAVSDMEASLNDYAANKAIWKGERLPGMLDFDPANTFATLESMENSDDKLKFLSNILIDEIAPTSAGSVKKRNYYSSLSNLTSMATNIGGQEATGTSINSVLQLALLVKDMYKRKFAGKEAPPTVHDGPLDRGLFHPNRGFDIVVEYGPDTGIKPLSARFKRVFKDCYLTGEEETVSASAGVGNDLSSSAQPILEIYPFFCKNIETKPR